MTAAGWHDHSEDGTAITRVQDDCAKTQLADSGLIGYLDERGEDVRDVALMWLDVFLEEGVEVEQQQLVHANRARHDGDDAQPRLEALVAAVEPREQALHEGLRRQRRS